MILRHFDDGHLPELMSWFPDAPSCRTWGGPEFRFPFTAATFREDARLGELASYGLVADARLVGFGQYYRRLGHCHLGRLAIAPGLRGRGRGATLVRELARRGQAELGVDRWSLFVLEGNERALRLYRRLGFSAVPYPEPARGLEGCIYMVSSEIPRVPAAGRFEQDIAGYLAKSRLGDADGAFHDLRELDRAALPELIAAYGREQDIGDRELLLEAIWQHRDQSVIPFLGEVLRDPALWQQAMTGLVALASPAALEALRAARTHQFPDRRAEEKFHLWLEEAIEQAEEEMNLS